MRFDVIHIADLRFPGGTSSAIAGEIRALYARGFTVGIVQKRARTLKQDRPINPRIADEIAAGRAVLLEPGTSVTARLAVLHNPYILETCDDDLPEVRADRKVLVAHQPLTDGNGVPYFDVATVQGNAEALVGPGVVWAPISPTSRENLIAAAPELDVLDEDWTNLIFPEDWAPAERRAPGERPVIGRHSRPDWAKWPATLQDLLTIYPDDPAYDVRMLGAGEGLESLLKGSTSPANWTLWRFNEVPVEDFLADLDIFVYFHHPDWIEGFGRTIAEAMASGLPVILPPHFRATFGEAALYREPGEVRNLIETLWSDPEMMRLQGRIAQKWIDRHYGSAAYLARIERLIGAPEDTGEEAAVTGLGCPPLFATGQTPGGGSEPANLAEAPAPSDFDVIHAGDFRTVRETALRVSNSVRIESENGYVTGLAHVQTLAGGDLDAVHPEIDLAVAEGAGLPIDPDGPEVATRLLVVHQPDLLFASLEAGERLPLPRVRPGRVVVLCDRGIAAAQARRINALLATLFRSVTWVATQEDIRQNLAGIEGLSLDQSLWTVAIHCRPWQGVPARERALPVIGRIGRNDARDWPNSETDRDVLYPRGGGTCVRILGWPKVTKVGDQRVPSEWENFRLGEIAVGRFVQNLDAIVHVTKNAGISSPQHLLLHAMAHGTPVLASKEVQTQVSPAIKVMAPAACAAFIHDMHADPGLRADLAQQQARTVRQAAGPQVHLARLRRLVGPAPAPARSVAPAVSRGARQRALFVSSNGVGMGHLTRLLSVARRMPEDVEPVFLTMSQALPIVRQCGYPVEYLPFHVYAGCDPADWNPWFAEQLGQIIDFHGARTVVFDGGNPYQGLLDAMATRPGTSLVWVRRGMWRETQNNETSIRRQRFFDLIVEPTEIAEAADKGATAYHRAFARKVDPIRFLDDSEVLSKEEACARLGLDPDRPRCLIQLGSGSNRDIVTMIDTVLDKVSKVPGMQPVLAEWLIAPNSLDFWPGVKRLRGFPLSLYFNAFDFTVSAAGYNSFNEIISFGLPAVFMANDHAMMDDQGGRARYAQDQNAAFHLPDNMPEAIGGLIESLLDPQIQMMMRMNAERISLGNGAQDAADAIAALN